jgi:hypothetical protein
LLGEESQKAPHGRNRELVRDIGFAEALSKNAKMAL